MKCIRFDVCKRAGDDNTDITIVLNEVHTF